MKKRIAIIMSVVMALTMVISVPVVSYAAENLYNTSSADNPVYLNNLGLDYSYYGVAETKNPGIKEYTAYFSYTPKVDCSLNLTGYSDGSAEKHKDLGTFEVKVNDVVKTDEEQKALELTKNTEYKIVVKRTYYGADVETTVTDPCIYIGAKLNPTTLSTAAEEGYTEAFTGIGTLKKYYEFTPTAKGGYSFTLTPATGYAVDSTDKLTVKMYDKAKAGFSETANYSADINKTSLNIILDEDSEVNVPYIVEVTGETELTTSRSFTLLAKKVSNGSSANVSVDKNIDIAKATSATGDTCLIIPYKNEKEAAIDLYGITGDGNCYNFEFTNPGVGSIQVNLYTDKMKLIESCYLIDESTEGFFVELKKDKNYIIQLAEAEKGSLVDICEIGVKMIAHTHVATPQIYVDEYGCIKYGCPCDADSFLQYAFYLDDVTVPNAAYTGKTVKPTVKFTTDVWVNNTEPQIVPTIPSTAYTIKVTSKNKSDIGKATAKVTFKDEYKNLGTWTVSFKIVPKGTTLSSVTAASKAFTVKWKKQATKTTGYQIQYGTSSSFSGAKTVTVSKNTTVSKKVTGLKSGKKYYVRVRTYKTVSKTKYYSSWSAAKTVTTK